MTRFIAAVFLALATVSCADAGTILKLGFGTDSLPDIELTGGVISTNDDGAGATAGDQNTEVTFLGALAGSIIVEGDRASFTVDNITISGEATIVGGTVLQPTTGGTFALYDPSNNLLLAGTLGDGTVSGPINNAATGGYLTTEFGTFTDGLLLSQLNTAGFYQSSFAIALTDVNDGNGLSVDSATNQMAPFTADATANIGGHVPEPASCLAVLLACLAIVPWVRSRT
jgi:hypothetical protein